MLELGLIPHAGAFHPGDGGLGFATENQSHCAGGPHRPGSWGRQEVDAA